MGGPAIVDPGPPVRSCRPCLTVHLKKWPRENPLDREPGTTAPDSAPEAYPTMFDLSTGSGYERAMATKVLDVDELLGSIDRPVFRPRPFYSPETDCLYVYLEDGRCYAEEIDHRLTLYKSSEDDHVVGLKVRAVRSLL